MDSKVISVSLPVGMLKKIDEAAAASYQSRSNFIRMAIVEKFGAKSQYELSAERGPDLRTDRQLANMYDFYEEYDEAMAEQEDENTKD